jgi:hypothetical protein
MNKRLAAPDLNQLDLSPGRMEAIWKRPAAK